MVQYIHTNNASSNLRDAISAGVGSIRVTSGHGSLFPNPAVDEAAFVTVEDRRAGRMEIMLCTARSGDVMTVTRGQQGTIPQSFPAGVSVSVRVTAFVLNEFARVAGGVFPISQIPMIPNSKLESGIQPSKLTGSGTLPASAFGTVPSSALNSVPSASLTGTINALRLPSIPASLLPNIPPANLTSVPAASLTGTIASARLPVIPSSLLTNVPAPNLSGRVPNASMTGSYDGLENLAGSGRVSFDEFVAAYGDVSDLSYNFGVSDSGHGSYFDSVLGICFATAGVLRLSIASGGVTVHDPSKFVGNGSGLTNLPAATLTGSVPTGVLRTPLNSSGTAPMTTVRAWAYINGNVTPNLRDDLNISTAVYEGSGVWLFTFSTPMSHSNYALLGSGGADFSVNSKTTTQFRVQHGGSQETAFSVIVVG